MFDADERTPGDGPTIGLILCAEENHTIARYSVLSEHKQLFAAKCLTHLPTEEELRRELERDRRLAEASVEAPHAEEPWKPKRAARATGPKKVTTALSPVIASRLEKAAFDNGFDHELPREGKPVGPGQADLTGQASDRFGARPVY